MGKKEHLTFQKGHLIFRGGASAPHAPPPHPRAPTYATGAGIINLDNKEVKEIIF